MLATRSHVRAAVRVGLILALALVAAGARAIDRPDPWITTKVKMALLTSKDVPALDVNVDTVNGRVTLQGFVENDAQKARAERAARGVAGVKDVRNLLKVRDEQVRSQIQVGDNDLRDRVETVLRRDGALEGSDIEVQSVNDGDVVLAGRAKTLSAHRRALEDARSVKGVRHVASEIQSPDELADAEIWSEGREKDGGPGSAVSDMWITTRTKMRLIADQGVPAFDLNVDSRDGVVTLFGTVPSDEARMAAERDAKEVGGVRAVRNELQVVPAARSESVARTDEALQKSVEDALTRRSDLDDADIDVGVASGVVRLTGVVRGEQDHVTSVTVAATTPGVRSVVDQLRVTPEADVAAPPR